MHKNHATRYYILTPCILQCEVLLIYYLKVFNFFTTLGHIDKTTKKNCRLSLKVGKNGRFAPENSTFERVRRGKEGCLILHMEIEKKNSIIERK